MTRNVTRAFPSALAFAALTAGFDDLVALPCKALPNLDNVTDQL